MKRLCQYEECLDEAQFALYRLNPDFTRTWMNLCDSHDKKVAWENMKLRAKYPDAQWSEHSK